jgi:uncharacterized protein
VNAGEIRRALARAAEPGDDDASWSLHTDDVVAHVPGRSLLGGDHRGRRALEALNKLENDLTKGSIEHQVHDTLVSEDHAVLLMRLMARGPGRGALDAQVVYVYHMHNEKLAELWIHPRDQAAFERF